jgi:YbbR domain-containing protein
VNLLAWVVSHWRLKLLALLLAIGLLTAVAFSENPPEYITVAEKVEYQFPENSGLVLIDPVTTVDVQVFGLRNAIQRYGSAPAGVSVNLAGTHPGAKQVFYARPKNVPPGLSFRSSEIPVTLAIEEQKSVVLPVEVRTSSASGVDVTDKIATCGNEAESCQVTVTGPPSLLQDLKAYVNYNASITSAGTLRTPNQAVLFERNGKQVDLSQFHSEPSPSWTPSTVTVKIDTAGGTQTKQVPITYSLIGTQSCGYEVSRVDLTPNQMVTVQGPVDEVSKVTSVSIGSIDITGLAGSRSFSKSFSTGGSQVTAEFNSVTVTVTTQQAFSCTTPKPAASPTPSASP